MTDENGLVRAEEPAGDAVPVLLGGQDERLAAPEEIAAFNEQFLRLIERRTAIYTMGDSTSVPRHVAADLLLSICFVLGIDPDDGEVPERLLGVNLEEEYRRNLARIEREVAEAKQLWRDVCVAMPLIDNVALRDTLKEIGGFFDNYDFRSMAHDIPCMIDYPLCHPVPEELQGIDYIAEYLRRLMIEARFLGRFEIEAIERALAASCFDPVEDLVNAYEAVATNAIGLALAGRDPWGLVIGGAERAEIARRLGALGEAGQGRLLLQAAECACDGFGVDGELSRGYLRELVPELATRVGVGLKHGR